MRAETAAAASPPNEAVATTHDVVIVPRDPVMVRDGRPFAAVPGATAVTLPWPLPATTAGMIRTTMGHCLRFDWHNGGPERALRVLVQGPLMVAHHAGQPVWQVYLRAPSDALVLRDEHAHTHEGDDTGEPACTMHARRPHEGLPPGAGHNLPPGLLPLRAGQAGKPEGGFAYWPLDAYLPWLVAATPAPQPPPARALGELPHDTRVHVAIDPLTRTGRDGALYSTEALAFADAPLAGPRPRPARAMLCRVATAEEWSPAVSPIAVLGGERRLVYLDAAPGLWPVCPPALREALVGARRLRVVLATPALFGRGWKPYWLRDGEHSLVGTPPLPIPLGMPGPRLRLAGAIVGRPEPVSGWNTQLGAPKPVRQMVPAGSVYFFEVEGSPLTAAQVEALWLAPLSDSPHQRADGFGLALPGLW